MFLMHREKVSYQAMSKRATNKDNLSLNSKIKACFELSKRFRTCYPKAFFNIEIGLRYMNFSALSELFHLKQSRSQFEAASNGNQLSDWIVNFFQK